MAKFKVGDKVRTLKYQDFTDCNEEGIIIEVIPRWTGTHSNDFLKDHGYHITLNYGETTAFPESLIEFQQEELNSREIKRLLGVTND